MVAKMLVSVLLPFIAPGLMQLTVEGNISGIWCVGTVEYDWKLPVWRDPRQSRDIGYQLVAWRFSLTSQSFDGIVLKDFDCELQMRMLKTTGEVEFTFPGFGRIVVLPMTPSLRDWIRLQADCRAVAGLPVYKVRMVKDGQSLLIEARK